MTPMPPALAGILWMLGSAVCFATVNAALKFIATGLPMGVLLFLRLLTALAWMAPWAWRAGLSTIATRRPILHLVRTVVGTASLACIVWALETLSLADATTLAFTRPLFMVVLAALFLAERPTPSRLVLTLLGFAGVLVIVRPGTDIDPAMLWALGSAACAAVNLVVIKHLSRTEPPARVVFWYAALGSALTAPWAAWEWQAPTWLQFAVIAGAAFLSVAGQYCVAQAASRAEATVIAPMDFFQLPVAALIGFVMWREALAWQTVAGALLILMAVLGIARTEGRRGRPAAAPSPPPPASPPRP